VLGLLRTVNIIMEVIFAWDTDENRIDKVSEQSALDAIRTAVSPV
jgi:hypothetical protein